MEAVATIVESGTERSRNKNGKMSKNCKGQ